MSNDILIEFDENGDVKLSADAFEEIVSALDIEDDDSSKGRKDYCCGYVDNSTHGVRASNGTSAYLKCVKHKPVKLATVRRGGC